MSIPQPEGPRPATALIRIALTSAVVSLAAMVWFSQSVSAVLSWFTLWILSPPIVALALAKLMPERFRRWPLLSLAGLALLLGPVIYVGAALSAPDALVFAVAPFFQLVALGIAWLAALVIGALAKRRAGG